MMCNALDSRTIRLLENIYIYMVKLNDSIDIKQSLTPAGENVKMNVCEYICIPRAFFEAKNYSTKGLMPNIVRQFHK